MSCCGGCESCELAEELALERYYTNRLVAAARDVLDLYEDEPSVEYEVLREVVEESGL